MKYTSLILSCSLVSMLAAACGSGSGNDDGMATTSAAACSVRTEDLFASDLYPDNGFGGSSLSQAGVPEGETQPKFYPLALATAPRWDKSHHGEDIHQSGSAACDHPARLLEDASTITPGGTGSRPEIQFRFPSFTFPAHYEDALHVAEHAAVQPTAELHVYFEKVLSSADGLTESEILKEQVFPMTMTCSTAFQVDFSWSTPERPVAAGADEFCRPRPGTGDASARECATFAVRPTGDACTFAIDHQTFEALDGTKVKASITGALARDAEGGYEVRVTQVTLD